jgi:Na+/proline symporter
MMLDTGVGIATLVLVCATFLFLGITYIGRRKQSVEDYTVSRNHAPTNVGIATLVASMFGTWVLLSPGETGANFGIISLVGYALGMAGIPVMFMFVGPRIRELMPNGHSVTEYVKHRFGTVPFIAIAVVIIFVIGIFITAEMTAITTAVSILTGSPAWATAVAVGLVVVAYTAYGGLRVSIYTDRIQFWVLIPVLLLLVIVAAALVGGTGVWSQARQTGLLSVSSSGSYFFGIVLIIGIVASNAFHPGMWQRVYTVESQRALNRSLWGAAALAIPITFLMGIAGIAAVGNGSVGPFEYPAVSAALFTLARDVFPLWMHFLMLVCALMLAMSTLDTMMNGLASGLAADLSGSGFRISTLMLLARVITVVVAIPAIIVASQGFSVLYVFLIADLLGAAIAVPMLIGLYSRRMPGWAVLLAGGVGIIIGALFYPKPDLISPWAITAPTGGQMFWAFASALVVSSVISTAVVWIRRLTSPQDQYDFDILNTNVQLIDEPATADD